MPLSFSSGKVRSSLADNRIVASEGSGVIANRISTGKKGNANQASGGGLAVQGKGNTINVASTDLGAIKAGSELAALALTNQANLSAAAIGAASDAGAALKSLAETKATGGENLGNKNVQLGLVSAAALALVAILFRR
jgi:hypothetical protein